jgi:hypothetical protein
MITKQRQLFFMVGDKFFKTLLEAQKHDLQEIVEKAFPLQDGVDPQDWEASNGLIVDMMINYSTPIVDILTTTPTSRAKARKNNGGEKPKKAKKQKITPATVPEA